MIRNRVLVGLVACAIGLSACSSDSKESTSSETTAASSDTSGASEVTETSAGTASETTSDHSMADGSVMTGDSMADDTMADGTAADDTMAEGGTEGAQPGLTEFPTKECTTDGLTELKVVTVGIYTDATLDLATQQCLFADNGVAVAYTVVPNPPAAIAAISSGEADIGYSPSIPIVRAASAGAPLKVLASADGYDQAEIDKFGAELDDTAVYATEELASAKDLEGKTVAVPARGAQLEVTTAYAVQEAGGDPSKVNFVALDLPNMVDAAKAGEVDAIALVSPFTLQAAEAGLVETDISAVDFFGAGAVGMWATTDAVIEAKGDAVRGFRDAIYAAAQLANDNPVAFWRTASEVTDIPFEEYETNNVAYIFPTDVTPDDLSKVAEKLKGLGFLESDPDVNALIVE